MSFICRPQTHWRMAKTPQHLHFIVWWWPNTYFWEIRPWPLPSNAIQNIWFLRVRKHVSGGRINTCSDLCLKPYFSHLALWHALEPSVRLRGENAISDVSVKCLFAVVPFSLEVFYDDDYKHQATIKIQHTYVCHLYHCIDCGHLSLSHAPRT